MMTAHFAFCVCILLVLKPLRAFRGNQVELAEFQAATLWPGSSKAKKIEELEKQLAELKIEDDRKAKDITNLKERMDVLEGLTNPVEQMAKKLNESFHSTANEETFWKKYDVTSLCRDSQNSLCTKSPGRFKEALKDPCMKPGPGCIDKNSADKGSCEREKRYFLRWSEVFCMHLHRDKGSDPVLDCIDGAINLLNSTDGSKYSSGEWAKAPAGKESVIFWSRIPEDVPFYKIAKIPRGFLLSSTLLGALTRMPGVGDLEKCTWSCQENMWASNSKGLVSQMPKLKPEYFVTGMNILQEVQRPFSETVAFRIELPALSKADSLGELHLASLTPTTTCDDLTMAIKMAFGSVSESKIHLRCALCNHCRNPISSDSCIADCITGGNAPEKSFSSTVKGLLLKNGRAQKAVKVGLTTIKDLMTDWKLTREEVLQVGFNAAKLMENGFKAKEVLKVEENDQEAFDIVYGMQMDDALDLLQESQNENLKGLVSDLQQLPKKICRKVTAQAAGDCNPLHQAASRGLLRLAEALIRKGADVEARARFDETPLHWAAEEGQDKVVKLLLRKGADVKARDRFGKTSLHWALEEGHDKVAELLIQKVADVKAKTSYGDPPLLYAAEKGHDKMAELLIQKGADVKATGRHRRTPLQSAVSNGHDKMAELLIQKGADVKAEDQFYQTPLHSAASNGHDKMAELLLQKGANVEARDTRGQTPLHWAAEKGQDKVVKLLIQKGANVEAKDRDGRTPLHFASKYRHSSVVRLLKAAGARQ